MLKTKPGQATQHAKVNLDVLKRMHYSDFNLGDEDDFRPEDIIDEDDDSDDSVLEQFRHIEEPEVSLLKEKVSLNERRENQYDEKVVGLKKHLKNSYPPSKENNEDQKNNSNVKKTTMMGRYREGRNVSQAATKQNLNTFVAYPPPGAKMRSNKSASKISQSMVKYPLKGHGKQTLESVPSLKAPLHKSTIKDMNSRKIHVNEAHKRKEAILLNQKHKNPLLQKQLGKIRMNNRSVYQNPVSVESTKNERKILKMVDKQINKGLRAANKSTSYNY